jgi:RimJ/RimL family protein N-acetyltransferase
MIYFEDSEIIIRDIEQQDVISLFSWSIDKELNQHDPRALPANSRELLTECEAFCSRFDAEIMNPDPEKRKYKYFIITDIQNQPIGFVNFFSIIYEKMQGEMGIMMGDKRHWNKGIAQKAVDEIVKYIFNELKMVRIYIETGETNTKAQKLFYKLGFVKCGEYMDEDFKFIIMEKLQYNL